MSVTIELDSDSDDISSSIFFEPGANTEKYQLVPTIIENKEFTTNKEDKSVNS